MKRIVPALFVSLIGLLTLIAAPQATAGSYPVQQCFPQPNYVPALWGLNTVQPNTGYTHDYCLNNGYLETLGRGFAYDGWVWELPAGIGFAGGQFDYNIRSNGNNEARIQVNDPGGTNTVLLKDAVMGAPGISGTHPWSVANPRRIFRAFMRCGGSCSAAGFNRIGRIHLTVNDYTPPVAAIHGGSILPGSNPSTPVSGVKDMIIYGRDVESGLRANAAFVNGYWVGFSGINCNVPPAAGEPPAFVYDTQPCPETNTRTVQMDTTQHPFQEGANIIGVCSWDFAITTAANMACGTGFTAYVDN